MKKFKYKRPKPRKERSDKGKRRKPIEEPTAPPRSLSEVRAEAGPKGGLATQNLAREAERKLLSASGEKLTRAEYEALRGKYAYVFSHENDFERGSDRSRSTALLFQAINSIPANGLVEGTPEEDDQRRRGYLEWRLKRELGQAFKKKLVGYINAFVPIHGGPINLHDWHLMRDEDYHAFYRYMVDVLPYSRELAKKTLLKALRFTIEDHLGDHKPVKYSTYFEPEIANSIVELSPEQRQEKNKFRSELRKSGILLAKTES